MFEDPQLKERIKCIGLSLMITLIFFSVIFFISFFILETF